ncbi:Crp/Fnr family transcriptional regulator [Sphingomonas dokdonensis]|uniref:Anaerobic regulatory protein n=1 Tax=Sphingomonas dokdonensis TaxID=344880 RepID=A0A245ZVI5_9SPHN|nr:Crp/Fnr family transcriptional regulator [Sphingomonas dokdonensis]OWK33755.1 anaerobic regulatory protein [Sphingomonas dokdonensis]
MEDAVEAVETVPPRTALASRGDRLNRSTLIIDGFACRYMDARDGYRQILSYHVAGDFIDLHSFPTRYIDHDIATITSATLAYVRHDRLETLMAKWPHLGQLLWFSTMLDAAQHREWIFRIGRLDAAGRLAHFMCETYYRMRAVGQVADGGCDLPLTQQDLGEVAGLTSVHVNRVLRRLREDGLAIVGRGKLQILDLDRLARLGEFKSDYLYLEDGPWQE